MPARTKIVFFGSDAIAVPALNFLASEDSPVEVVGVFSQPDRPQGRGQKYRTNPISEWALARSLPLWQPEKLTDKDTRALVETGAAMALVMAYGHLLKTPMLASVPLGFLNLHASLLPAYRGASPMVGALSDGIAQTGVSLMRIVPALDAGPVCDVEKFAIGPSDTTETVRAKMAAACVPLLRRALPAILEGKAIFKAQNDAKVSFTRKIDKADGTLDFLLAAEVLASRVRALSPWPGCAISVNGLSLKIFEAVAVAQKHGAIPGTVLHAGQDGLIVATGSGVLKITELQRPGGRRIAAGDFLRGFPLHIGTLLESTPMRPLVSIAPFARKSP